MTSHLFFVIGPAGSGKSTVSTLIARHLRAAYLDKDSVATLFTEALLTAHGSDPHERDNNEYYQHVVMDLEYQTLLRLAGDNLRVGTPVVLDAPFVPISRRRTSSRKPPPITAGPPTSASPWST